jgi:hypothetical protein
VISELDNGEAAFDVPVHASDACNVLVMKVGTYDRCDTIDTAFATETTSIEFVVWESGEHFVRRAVVWLGGGLTIVDSPLETTQSLGISRCDLDFL